MLILGISPRQIHIWSIYTKTPQPNETQRTRQIHFKNNRGVGGAAFAYDMGGGGSAEVEETLQDAILAEKVSGGVVCDASR